jgi:hypothetical protein
MGRRIRIEYAGAASHVMARGNQGRDASDDEFDRKLYQPIKVWQKAVPLPPSRLRRVGRREPDLGQRVEYSFAELGKWRTAGRGGEDEWVPNSETGR